MQAPERVGSVVCGTRALSLRRESSVVVARGLSCPTACGILLPQPGIEPVSPALEGRFFTTGPPGKSREVLFNCNLLKGVFFFFFERCFFVLFCFVFNNEWMVNFVKYFSASIEIMTFLV